jgi:hypothetical protein
MHQSCCPQFHLRKKKNLLDLKKQVDPHTRIVVDFNIPLSQIYKSLKSKKKLNKETSDLDDTGDD